MIFGDFSVDIDTTGGAARILYVMCGVHISNQKHVGRRAHQSASDYVRREYDSYEYNAACAMA